MRELDFSFEQRPWELFLETKKPGDRVNAVNLIAMLEGEDEETAVEAFDFVDEKGLILELSGLASAEGTGEAAVRLRREAALAKAGLHPEDLEEGDTLRLYLEELASIPAFGDENALALRCAQGDEGAREQLTNLGLSRVVELAKEHTGYGVLLLDLIQEGSLGLWNGVSRYEGGAYAPFRDRYIRNAMARSVILQAISSGLGAKMRTALQDYRDTDQRLLSELGRNATLEEIAAQLHMSREEAETVRKMMEDALLLQQAEKLTKPQESQPEDEQAVEDTAYFQMRQRISELLSQLSEQEAQLLTLRFGLDQSLPLSPEETGRKLGMTPEEVIRTEAAALKKLRAN